MMMVADKPPNWLAVSLGKEGTPRPPALSSERIKMLVGKALLRPRSMTELETQELAASVLSHLVAIRER